MIPGMILAVIAVGLAFFPSITDAQNEVFQGSYLNNAPTGEVLEKGLWEVRISHRFIPNANEDRLDKFFGLNGPASVFIGLYRGALDDLMISLSRTNYGQLQFELRYRTKRPLLGTLLASTNWNSNRSINEKEAYSFVFQGITPLRVRENLSVLLVPSYLLSLHSEADDILSLGLALSYDVSESISLMTEWFPVLSGEIYGFDTWGVGVAKHIGWHDFALVFTNSTGIGASDYLRGGDLDIKEGEFRLGFNIFRKL